MSERLHSTSPDSWTVSLGRSATWFVQTSVTPACWECSIWVIRTASTGVVAEEGQSMAELSWLRSSPAKGPIIGSLSSGPPVSYNSNSTENLFDLLQNRFGSGSTGDSGHILASPSNENPSLAGQLCRSSDHEQMTDDSDCTAALLKTAGDENHLHSTVEQLPMNMQSSLWPVADTSGTPPLLAGLGAHHRGLYNNAHIAGLHPAAGGGMVVDGGCQFTSFPALKPPDIDPAPQLQALRDFMAYGNNNGVNNALGPAGPQHHHAAAANMAGTLGCPPLFLHLGDEGRNSAPSSLLHLPGIPTPMQRAFIGETSSPAGSNKPDLMAYRALCQGDLFGTERSPHRTQFQRENHILAERQRREEMNEKFSALRAMIPKATKKDKASIVGDTIGYVLELEKRLKHLQACKASRKGYFKLLKRRPSVKTSSGAPDDDGERSMTGTTSTPPDLQDSSTAPPAAAVADDRSNAAVSIRSDDVSSHHLNRKKSQDLDLFDDPIMTCSSAAEPLNACADSFQVKDKDILDIRPGGTVGDSEVDVQSLGEQAVIKIVCARSSGLVLRILLALDECKVDIVQSNVTTVAEKSVHFITVQVSSGLSSTTEEMIAVLHKASRSPLAQN